MKPPGEKAQKHIAALPVELHSLSGMARLELATRRLTVEVSPDSAPVVSQMMRLELTPTPRQGVMLAFTPHLQKNHRGNLPEVPGVAVSGNLLLGAGVSPGAK